MNKPFLTLLTLLVLLSVQCSMNSNKVDSPTSNSNHSLKNSTSLETQSQTDVARIKEDKRRYYEEIMRNDLKRVSSELHLTNLREAVLDHETEIRLWTGFGMFTSRCFILKQRDGSQEALHIAPRFAGDKIVMDAKGEILIDTSVLGEPRSGWEELNRFLKEQGIDSPIRLSLDLDEKQESGGGDVPEILVEVKSGKEYSAVNFSILSKSDDGQKALKVCRRIEQEFGIVMGC